MQLSIVQLAFECANCVSLARLLLAQQYVYVCCTYYVAAAAVETAAAIPVIAPSFPVTAREIRLLL